MGALSFKLSPKSINSPISMNIQTAYYPSFFFLTENIYINKPLSYKRYLWTGVPSDDSDHPMHLQSD